MRRGCLRTKEANIEWDCSKTLFMIQLYTCQEFVYMKRNTLQWANTIITVQQNKNINKKYHFFIRFQVVMYNKEIKRVIKSNLLK